MKKWRLKGKAVRRKAEYELFMGMLKNRVIPKGSTPARIYKHKGRQEAARRVRQE